MTGLGFVKAHGLGNDFVVIDRRETPCPVTPALARAIADRHRGVGFDQLITVDRHPQVAATVTFWNSDGSESGACGNGTRCVAGLLMTELETDAVTLKTERGLLVCRDAGEGQITVDMLEPRLEWDQIPLAERMDTRGIDLKLGPIDAPTLHSPGCVNMGNPHAVFFVDDVAAHDIARAGPFLENHFLFPERANIGFAQVRDPGRIRLRVWERGAGLTLACGSGACAAVVAGVRKQLLDRTVEVEVDGGTLTVTWRESDGHVLMTGPWSRVFDAEFDADWLAAVRAEAEAGGPGQAA
ncbi:diaminopimelate epimerase [Futiania mangrovi]|uniref:Diaminopimelate epimerase n=1 Tax=Futiania mangrovi TaxID=2959716 RepID=A0A9J6PFN8_9PROT|nr:diaminopimelate epimerase [Futiania mangrovii]MCP1336640.1 diaminopimelate epimerase [Futiania mangrovii]